jgi:hypothetical protein
LLYLEPVLHRKAVPSLHFALEDEGFLVLGKSETLAGFRDLFTLIDQKNGFFAKSGSRTVSHIQPKRQIIKGGSQCAALPATIWRVKSTG